MTGDGGAAYLQRLVREIKQVVARYDERDREAARRELDAARPGPPGGRPVPWFLKELWRQTGQ